jgi:hypothetical protein
MISPYLLLLAALAAARVTRLITRDRITLTPRLWVINKLGPDTMTAYLITCDWCAGLWTGAVVTSAAWHWQHSPWLQVPVAALAVAQAVGMIASRESD